MMIKVFFNYDNKQQIIRYYLFMITWQLNKDTLEPNFKWSNKLQLNVINQKSFQPECNSWNQLHLLLTIL